MGCWKSCADRELDPPFPRAGDQLDAADRVAAEREEVVVDADLVEAAAPAPRSPRASPRVRSAARRTPRPRSGRLASGAGSASRSTLPLGGERQRRQDDERGRHHVLRQRRLEVRAQLARPSAHARAPARRRRPARLVRRRPRARPPPPRATPGCAAQRRLDLAELDPEAADLDLVVDPAEVLQVAVRRAGGRGRRSGRAGSPPRRRTGRARSARPSAPAGRDSRAPRRRRRRTARPARRPAPDGTLRVEHVEPQIGDRAADHARRRRPQIGRAHRPVGDVHRRLGDAVHVDQARAARRRGARTRARRLGSSSASPPKITARRASGSAAVPASASARISWRNADGVWLSTVTLSPREQLAERVRRAADSGTARPPAGRRGAARPRSPRPRSRTRRSGTASRRPGRRSRTSASVASNRRTTLACVTTTPFGRPVEPEV